MPGMAEAASASPSLAMGFHAPSLALRSSIEKHQRVVRPATERIISLEPLSITSWLRGTAIDAEISPAGAGAEQEHPIGEVLFHERKEGLQTIFHKRLHLLGVAADFADESGLTLGPGLRRGHIL